MSISVRIDKTQKKKIGSLKTGDVFWGEFGLYMRVNFPPHEDDKVWFVSLEDGSVGSLPSDEMVEKETKKLLLVVDDTNVK